MPNSKLLVVEDERVVAKDLSGRLQRSGYSVCGSAYRAEAAVDMAQELRPDLVLMDIVLKGNRDGIDAAGEIRRRFGIPVIFLTAYSDAKTLERARSTGPYGYILKPFNDREVVANIEMALEKRDMERMIEHLSRVLAAIRGVNQLIVRLQDRDRLIREVCGCLVEIGRAHV